MGLKIRARYIYVRLNGQVCVRRVTSAAALLVCPNQKMMIRESETGLTMRNGLQMFDEGMEYWNAEVLG
jgi:hypothetical protein